MALRYDPNAFDYVPKRDVKLIIKKVEWLWAHRKEIHHHPLKESLSGYYKRRLDLYRIIYSYENDQDIMIVHLVGTRDEIYQHARRQLP